MQKSPASAKKNVRYRQRLREAGWDEVLLQLPQETIALLDAIKARQSLSSRGQAFQQLVEQGRAIAQQLT